MTSGGPVTPADRFALACGGLSPASVVAAARRAEDLGFEAVWLGESDDGADPFVLAATVLRATERVACGPGIARATDRHPLALLRAVVTLDDLFPGRALLGIGRGDPGSVAGGVPPPGAALEDAARICRTFLDGRALVHRGRAWSVTADLSFGRRPDVPLAIAAVGPRSLRLAGEVADIVLLNYGAPCEYISWARQMVLEAAQRVGREATRVTIAGLVLVARTDGGEGAVADVENQLRRLYADPAQAGLLLGPAGEAPGYRSPLLPRVAAVGDVDTCRQRIAEYRAAGLDVVVLLPSGMHALFDEVPPRPLL